jgi:hypothetical protein
MAIYQLYEQESEAELTESFDKPLERQFSGKKGPFFSTLVTRLCFLLLFAGDCLWLVWNFALLLLSLVGYCLSLGKVNFFLQGVRRSSLQFVRSVVCGLSLLIGLFSPPFGIMVACTYFLMYDKAGMEEVVPASLQAQFKEIFQTEL